MAFLAIEDLSHRFGSRRVLDGVSFGVARGEILGLLGPNGSGKSTALSVLSGILPRQAGRVRFDDRDVEGHPRWLRARLGVVFQEPSLDPMLTGRENLTLAGRLHGLSRAESEVRAEAGLARAGLSERARDRVETYSGGMRRRLDLARAFLHRPDLLLLDEPTAGLDEHAFRATWQLIEELQRERAVTAVVATHRPEEAERCHRLAVFDGGRVALIDTPQGLRDRLREDVVSLQGPNLEELRELAAQAAGLPARIEGESVVITCAHGHELIPRLFERLPEGRIQVVNLRRPTLADAFHQLTGRSLAADATPESAQEAT